MKKTLLTTLFASFMGLTAAAQEFPYNLNLFDEVVYYNMYEGLVDEPVPEGINRTTNSSYTKKLTQDQIDAIGNTLILNVTLSPLCDTYDRIGNVNLVMAPIGTESYGYNDEDIIRIEMGRFITPFMNLLDTSPDEVPYTFEVNNITKILHDATITAEYEFWVELEVYGYQGDASAGAVHDLPNTCPGRNDVYMGSLDIVSDNSADIIQGDDNLFVPLSYKYELKNYTLDGTDEIGETVKTITFTLESAMPNAKLYLITSNHGQQEEFIRRWHYVDFDNEEVLQYKPGGLSCVPYSVYNTMPNCIYLNCAQNPPQPRPDTNSAWSWNNWCPGNVIPTRVIELGDLTAGEHSFKIDVPSAAFLDNEGNNGNGYFPMSVYLQGYEETLGTEDFEALVVKIFPNPVNDVMTISTDAQVTAVKVTNMLGQMVLTSNKSEVDMSQLQNGVYMVEIQLENGRSAMKKIVKE